MLDVGINLKNQVTSMNFRFYFSLIILCLILFGCTNNNDGIEINDEYILDNNWAKKETYKNYVSISRIIPEKLIENPENFKSEELYHWKTDYTSAYSTSYKREWREIYFNQKNKGIVWHPVIDNGNDNFRESDLNVSLEKIGKLKPFSFYEINGLRNGFRFLIYVSKNGNCRVVKQKYGKDKGAW